MKKVLFPVFGLLMCLQLNAAKYIVNSTADSGPGTLRDGINWTNGNLGMDTILFNIPGAGVQTISPLSALPNITDQNGLLIDGFSQPGASRGTTPPKSLVLMIYLSGSTAGATASGLTIVASNVTIQGLGIGNFGEDGVKILSNSPPSMFNYVSECRIGTDIIGGTAQPNGTSNPGGVFAGVSIKPGACIGSSAAVSNHVQFSLISGNFGDGVSITSCPPDVDVSGNTVEFNYIGTDNSGMAGLPNTHAGVLIGEGAHDNLVYINTISANLYEGVSIMGYADVSVGWDSYRNTVHGCYIGVGADGATPLGNLRNGVSIGHYGPVWKLGFATRNVVKDCIIQHNSFNGIMVWENSKDNTNADRNSFRDNKFGFNGEIGIDLQDDGITENDTTDPDVLANQELNFPVITSAVYDAGMLNITGFLDINVGEDQAEVEFLKVISQGNDSVHGEGENLPISPTSPSVTGAFTASIPWTYMIGDSITAIARDSAGNTSEFAVNYPVTPLVGIHEIRNSQVFVWPNPTAGSITLRMTGCNAGVAKVRLMDQLGRIMLEQNWHMTSSFEQDLPIDLRALGLKPGLFELSLESSSGGVLRKKVVLQ